MTMENYFKVILLRQERSAPVTEALRRWRDDQLASSTVADGTPIRRALNYAFNHWDALTRFLKDGKIPISNNRSELELRRLVIGRANWLFCGSDDTAPQTCTFVSLVASCELHKIDPEAHLRDLFRVLPVWPRNRVIELAPKYWARTRARLDSAELALPLGPITVPPPLSANQAEKADAHEGAVAHGS
jgi:transposase